MKIGRATSIRWLTVYLFAALAFVILPVAEADPEADEIRILQIQGSVEVMPAGAKTWVLTQTNQVLQSGDKLRTGLNSRAALRWSDQSVVPVGALTELEILPPDKSDSLSGLNLVQGVLSFFHRDKPGRIRILAVGAIAGVEGTEFVMQVAKVDGTERVTLSVLDGKVRFSNAQGTISLTNQQQAIVEPGQAPKRTAGFIANNLLQWCFYYPGVLEVSELPLTTEETNVLGESLAAYRSGDLLLALAKYPAGRQPGSAAEQIYYSALLLSVGEMAPAEASLAALSTDQAAPRILQLATALRTLIAAVKREPNSSARPPELASEMLAASYDAQSRAESPDSLKTALALARQAVTQSPGFGFAWERVAELEFSFGHTEAALAALNKSLALAPRNPQAFALKGFLLAAQNRIATARQQFDAAIAIDGALGNAWLGRGLCKIRQGQVVAGREDLEVAAALEPNRAILRSYLGKAFNQTGDPQRADHELVLARRLDPNDPTSWLYSALLHQQANRVNEAIRDLETSEDLNDNRSVFRSKLLLDEDAAVRGANLAGIYQDAGMDDVSVREATRAVNYDYANYSAHLFLANSYNQLRDPNQINLRYETPWLSEYLIANLLAPVGAGTLSQAVSQQEYSKLFQHDGVGLASSTGYSSRGDWTESASQYGTFGNFGYAVDTYYLSANGQQPNNSQDQLTVSTQLKYDVTPKDSFFLQAIYYNATGGDLKQYYDPQSADMSLNTHETQEPLLLLGYRHQWSPGIETLAMAGRFNDTLNVSTANEPVLLLAENGGGTVIAVPTPTLPTASLNYQSTAEIYSAEVQQIFQKNDFTLIFGGRGQFGAFDTQSAQGASTPTLLSSMTQTTAVAFATSPNNQNVSPDFVRWTGYGYFYWRPFDPLQLDVGGSYDYLEYPQNYRDPPISGSGKSESQFSPKAGFTWTPLPGSTVRFAYTKSLGGVSFDQSVRLEPSQVAGFNQAFRSLIPESIAGSVSGAKFETYGLALEQKFKTGTYLGLEGQILNSEADQTIGVVNLAFPPAYTPAGTPQHLDYTEENLIFTVNQLLGNCWSVGARDQVSQVQLQTTYADIPASVSSAHYTENDATLNLLTLFAVFNHPSGIFARIEGNWYSQDNSGYSPGLSGANFWQLNLFGGYRFWQRRAQIQLGLLNVTDQDYHLNPLNLYSEIPQQRTFVVNFQFNF